jgi:hypothetical protein
LSKSRLAIAVLMSSSFIVIGNDGGNIIYKKNTFYGQQPMKWLLLLPVPF